MRSATIRQWPFSPTCEAIAEERDTITDFACRLRTIRVGESRET